MITEIHIEQALKELFDHIEFTTEPVGLYDPLRYMIAIGGKRLLLVFAQHDRLHGSAAAQLLGGGRRV